MFDGNRVSCFVTAIPLLMAACAAGAAAPVPQMTAVQQLAREAMPPLPDVDQRAIVHLATDNARDRIWVLALDGVRVYRASTRQLVRQVVLRGWSVARFACAPALVIDRSGNGLVSSNAQPRLWKIDSRSFEVTERVVSLRQKEGWDIGFGALAFAPDGSLYGLTAAGGALWRIDERGSAQLIDFGLPLLNACVRR
jgi:hypothetical protein